MKPALRHNPNMRLKHLQLQGYKTFATKAEFFFPSGITALFGPNGSGKSNVADAIRWVLGEQSYSTLRGKSTADMIFSGSQSRARAGMAEATLTLDNSDGWLPLEFSEVTIGRRAYRDGQNEYRINGSRVRLRDVTELLGQSGLSRRNYTVIGQGLVDAVLSLRPIERRELFEEAAGIAHYRAKRDDALRKLEETHRNLERVRDIVAEIEPRLKRLERQAGRAQEHSELSSHLEELLRTWYGYRWGRASKDLKQAQGIVTQRADEHHKRQQEVQTLTDRFDRIRQTQSDLRRQLGAWHRQSSELHAQAEDVQRELAVLDERSRQLLTQREEHLAEIATLDARLTAQTERVDGAQAELAAVEEVLAQREKEAQAAQAALNARLAEREALLQTRNAARERQGTLRTEVAERQSRQEALAERIVALDAQAQANQAEIARLKGERDAQAVETARIEARIAQLERELAQARQGHAELEKQRQDLTQQLEREQTDLRRMRETEAEVVARFELLSQLRRDFAIYGQAARALLTAQLPGVHGALAQLIRVPAGRQDLSSAVEAALGAYAGAIVVADWQSAQSALQYLRSTDTPGRVVLLAQEAYAPTHSQNDGQTPLSTQVRCDDALRPLVDRLLGRAYLAPDLETARATLKAGPPGTLCVTPEGQVLRGDGAIEGGRLAKQTSPLAQEQEWSRLNERRVELGAQRERLAATVAQTGAALEAIQKQLTAKGLALDELSARRVTANTARDQAKRQAERLEQEIEWRQSQVASAETDQAALRQQQTDLAGELDDLAQAQTDLAAEILKISQDLETLPTETLNDELTAAQIAVGAARQTRRGQETILRELQTSLEQLQQERQIRQRRAAELMEQKESVAARAAQLTQGQTDLSAQLEALKAQTSPAQARLEASEKELLQVEEAERRERARLREFESHLTTARLEVQRREDELARLRSRIEEDLGLVEMELSDGLPGQTPLPLRPLVSKLPVVKQLPEGLEDEIKNLRTRLRRLGAVNPNAPTEYQEALERHTFLTEQSADLVAASDSLRQVIAELDGLIEHAFRQTFEAVAAEFEQAFTALFGGGKARLELTEPEDLTHTGVEIVAQPPGKRLQALASLSGGERSLTAVALIFSILKVSPTPFCILDEVDAMLDEANVGRFRQMLESLTEHTQIVIITHNRGTIAAADTIYGITMESDSASKILSVRMDGEQIKEF
jgi:chromosome segregation protein